MLKKINILLNYNKYYKYNPFILNYKYNYRKKSRQFSTSYFPVKSLIETTNICNLNCAMCNTVLSKRPSGHMNPEVFKTILNKLKSINIATTGIHTVGEPFMYKYLDEALQIMEDMGFNIFLSTNGQFPDKLQAVHDAHPRLINNVRFSTESSKKNKYESIRKKGRFENILKSLKNVKAINDNVKGKNIEVYIDCVLSNDNMLELKDFLDLYSNYTKLSNIRFNLIDGLSPDSSYFKNNFPYPNLIKKTVPCKLPFNKIYFTYDGQATLCCRDYNAELTIGDVTKNPLFNLWNCEKANEIREKQLGIKEMDIPSCTQCYEPVRAAKMLTIRYIDYLIHHLYPKCTNTDFGDRIHSFLHDLNSAFGYREKDVIKKYFTEF